MFKKLSNRQHGFTLIEIVIVLAIAGLIMGMIFLAVQGAQRGRRDTERKSAAGRLLAAAEQTASNNTDGSLPANCSNISSYNDGGYTCVDGASTDTDSTQTLTQARYYDNTDCANYSADNTRIAAARIKLETSTTPYCVDSD